MKKKMKTTLLIIISTLLLSNCFADPEPPIIRSFIEITLRDGSKVQGAITIAKPFVINDYYTYVSNGIYYNAGNFEGVMHFYIDLEGIEILSGTNSFYTTAKYKQNHWIVIPDMGSLTLKYVDCRSINSVQEKFEFNNEDGSIDLKENAIQNFQFTNYLPLQLVVAFPSDSTNIQKIPFDNILSISMIANPSKALSEQLTNHREKMNNDLSNAACGFNMPIWYHEIIANNELFYEYLIKIKY